MNVCILTGLLVEYGDGGGVILTRSEYPTARVNVARFTVGPEHHDLMVESLGARQYVTLEGTVGYHAGALVVIVDTATVADRQVRSS